VGPVLSRGSLALFFVGRAVAMMESSGIQKSNKGARRGRQGRQGEAAERYQVVQVKGRLASSGSSYIGPLQDVFKTRE